MSIAVLITCHNRKNLTVQCVDRVYRQAFDDVDVFLTDDGCTDGTPEEVTKLFPRVNIIKGDGSLFWNRGMYVAWKEALKGDYNYYIWLNDDTSITNDCFVELLKASQYFNDKAVIVGTTSARGNPSQITYGGRNEKERLIESIDMYNKCYTFNGNIVLVPQFVVDKIGIISDKFHHRFGDTEYGFRANREGIEVMTACGILGECDIHSSLPIYCDPSKKISQRLKSYFSVTGGAPCDLFYLRYHYFGFFAALFTLVSSFIHTLFPSLWKGEIN